MPTRPNTCFFALGSGNGVKSGFEFSLGQLERGHGFGGQAVETLGVFQHRSVTTLLHVGQDVSHPLLNGGVRVGRPMQTRLKISIKSACSG